MSGDSNVIKVGILTVSDSCFHGQANDKSGENLKKLIDESQIISASVKVKEIVPDEVDLIKDKLVEWCYSGLNLILTTGGTGFSPRDVTPEATRAVIEKEAPGLTLAMLKGSLDITPFAMLSRPVCGIRKRTLIINLPGSMKAAQECLQFVMPALPHALDLLQDHHASVKATHRIVQSEGVKKGGQEQVLRSHCPPAQVSCGRIITQRQSNVSLLQTVSKCDTYRKMPELPSDPCSSKSLELTNKCAENSGDITLSYDESQCTDNSVSCDFEPEEQLAPEKNPSCCFVQQGQMDSSHDMGRVRTESLGEVLSHVSTNGLTVGRMHGSTSPRHQQTKDSDHCDTTNAAALVCASNVDIYDFVEDESCHLATKEKLKDGKRCGQRSDSGDCPILPAKQRRSSLEGVESYTVSTGPALKLFLANHPKLLGLYMNKGKRHVKRHLVSISRDVEAIDRGSWTRGSNVMMRNRLDDHFVLTDEGQSKLEAVQQKKVRDERVVCWYMWCPGHGNCLRKCGGYGRCLEGCKGAAHKQDRHNCAVLVILKLFLSDINTWYVLIKGHHVPSDSGVVWQPPHPKKQRIDQDLRDLIISFKDKASYEQILSMMRRKFHSLPAVMRKPINKRWLQRIIYAMKLRWQKKNYNVTGEMTGNLLMDSSLTVDAERGLVSSNGENSLGHMISFIIGDESIMKNMKNVVSQSANKVKAEQIEIVQDSSMLEPTDPGQSSCESIQHIDDSESHKHNLMRPLIKSHSQSALQSTENGTCTQHQHDKQEEGHHHHHHHESHHQHGHSDKSGVDASHVARRHRISPYPMISVQEAIDKVMAELQLSGTELIHYSECLGMVLAEDVFAKDPLPPFPASIKDGYAVIAADGAGLRTVLGDSTAGDMPEKTLTSGYCIRISTGAAVPPGADAVIQVEDTELVKASDDACTELEIKLLTEPKVGQDIRPVGSDIKQGEKILSAGQKLGPSELGLLATVGVTKVMCYKLPAVGILSTGNELMEPGEDLKPGKIRDSNRTTLLALLREQHFHPQDIGIAKDMPEELLNQVKEALDHVDVLVTSGGVSMGEKDLLRDVLVTDLKATVHFARVFMKPGKPTTFATLDYNEVKKFVFGLPGNPVSATVTCHLYIVPALKKMAGEVQPERTKIKAKLTTNLRLDPRPEYHRCCLYWPPGEAVPEAVSTGNQMSSRLLSMRAANALLVLPPRTDELQELRKGELVDVLIIAPL